MTLISATSAALSNRTFNDIVTDPNFWQELSSGNIEDYLISQYGVTVGNLMTAVGQAIFTGHMELDGIPALSPTLGSTPDPLVKTIRWITKDPLVLDLDGDGLEITPLKAGVMFDADGDTVKNASAWIGADDGLLVRDIDGNGVIDSGRELFGDNTRLANGQTAAHGFAALADLDLGSVVNGVTMGARDGIIDARDACFSALRVWRDLDQDGVSQANELATLTDADIAAIGLSNTATSKNYGGDATLTRAGAYTRADGSEGEAGNFLLAVNYFERAFTPVEVSEAARALPDFKGTGWVRDLREAATLEPGLIDLVALADNAPTRAGYTPQRGQVFLYNMRTKDLTPCSHVDKCHIDSIIAGFRGAR
jgi:hypothetical protein